MNEKVFWYDDRDIAENYIIAQDDDEDIYESGYVVLDRDGECLIGCYSHDSCYGTWDGESMDCPGLSNSLSGTWLWMGNRDELIDMAKMGVDPCMPPRLANSKDFNYDHLMAVYQQVIAHYGVD
jgi:hypothetical protein